MLFYAVNLNNCKHGCFAQFLSRLQCYASIVMLLGLVQALKSHCRSQPLHGAASGPSYAAGSAVRFRVHWTEHTFHVSESIVWCRSSFVLSGCQLSWCLQYTVLRHPALLVKAMWYFNCSLTLAVVVTFVCTIWKGNTSTWRWNAGVSMKICVCQSQEM